MFRCGFYQFRPLFGKVKKNVEKVAQTLDGVKADLLVLPELAFTGYYFRDREELFSLAEELHQSPTVERLGDLCQKNEFHIVSGFAEREGEKIYNSALLIGPTGVVAQYRKIHLFNKEKDWFDPGNLPLNVADVKGVKVGMMVCFDWIFPEVCRTLALKGAQIIAHPSNLVLSYCQQTMLSRSLENGVFSITANRFGADRRPFGDLRFTGKSQVVDPRGNIIFRAASQRESLYVCEIDPMKATQKMITEKNHILDDRRPEFYHI
ncbi:MAG: nitrilase [Calditrichia bacterium]